MKILKDGGETQGHLKEQDGWLPGYSLKYNGEWTQTPHVHYIVLVGWWAQKNIQDLEAAGGRKKHL